MDNEVKSLGWFIVGLVLGGVVFSMFTYHNTRTASDYGIVASSVVCDRVYDDQHGTAYIPLKDAPTVLIDKKVVEKWHKAVLVDRDLIFEAEVANGDYLKVVYKINQEAEKPTVIKKG
ncbi:MAG: hypothetical protein WCO30_02440, partial [bacterium]